MASHNKRQRLEAITAATAEISKLDTKAQYMYISNSIPELLESLTIGLRAGEGLVDPREEVVTPSDLPTANGEKDELKHEGEGASENEEGTPTVSPTANGEDEEFEPESKEVSANDSSEEEEDDEEDDEGDNEGDGEYIDDLEEENGSGYVRISEGKPMALAQYFGSDFAKRIVALHSVAPIPIPEHMTLTPHDYQLKGAAQILYACQSASAGLMVGDGMGLGKTLQAVLAMYIRRNEPGLCLVLCPASIIPQWIANIEGAFEEGHGMTAIHLNSSRITAHQILAGGYDVVVCSFEFAEANGRAIEKHKARITEWKKTGDPMALKPKRPTAALASAIWELAKLPFKMGVQDEAHQINKRDGQRHISIMKLAVKSWVLMSGTLPHNRWNDMSGYLDFLKGHPYTTDAEFLMQFSQNHAGGSRNPSGAQMKLLQRFLQAHMIMRSRDVLKLPPCKRVAFPVTLTTIQCSVVSDFTDRYRQAVGMDKDKNPCDIAIGVIQPGSPLGLAVKAQMYTLHPLLIPKDVEADEYNPQDEDLENVTAENVNDRITKDDLKAGEKRRMWLDELDGWSDDEIFCSPHVCALTAMVYHLVTTEPARKIVIFSQYLRYLDILSLALKKRYSVECLRYDGRTQQKLRPIVQKDFENEDLPRPLLITAGAGSVGLNLTAGKVVILTEEWWNASAEFQAICRAWRQGQDDIVSVIKLHVVNSEISGEIARVRRSKAKINKELVGPLLHTWDKAPEIVELLY